MICSVILLDLAIIFYLYKIFYDKDWAFHVFKNACKKKLNFHHTIIHLHLRRETQNVKQAYIPIGNYFCLHVLRVPLLPLPF